MQNVYSLSTRYFGLLRTPLWSEIDEVYLTFSARHLRCKVPIPWRVCILIYMSHLYDFLATFDEITQVSNTNRIPSTSAYSQQNWARTLLFHSGRYWVLIFTVDILWYTCSHGNSSIFAFAVFLKVRRILEMKYIPLYGDILISSVEAIYTQVIRPNIKRLNASLRCTSRLWSFT